MIQRRRLIQDVGPMNLETILKMPVLDGGIQYGSITIAVNQVTGVYTLPIAVDPNRSGIRILGCTVSATATAAKVRPRIALTNGGVDVTATRNTSDASVTATIYFGVFQFRSGVLNSNVQRGSAFAVAAAAATGTQAITNVSTSLTLPNLLGVTSNDATSTAYASSEVHLTQTAGNQLTLTRGAAATTGDLVGSWEVFEFSSSYVEAVLQCIGGVVTGSTRGGAAPSTALSNGYNSLSNMMIWENGKAPYSGATADRQLMKCLGYSALGLGLAVPTAPTASADPLAAFHIVVWKEGVLKNVKQGELVMTAATSANFTFSGNNMNSGAVLLLPMGKNASNATSVDTLNRAIIDNSLSYTHPNRVDVGRTTGTGNINQAFALAEFNV